MRSLFSDFHTLWPSHRKAAIKSLMGNILYVAYPEDKQKLADCPDPKKTVVVLHNGRLSEMAHLLSLGFEHLLHREREDFASELLAASLIINKPLSFQQQPLDFFINGFTEPGAASAFDMNWKSDFRSSEEKPDLLKDLQNFLAQTPRLDGVRDICLQAADELVSNVLFSAPVSAEGHRLFADLPRTTPVELPAGHVAQFFVAFSPKRIVVGCQDPFGSMSRAQIIPHLEWILGQKKVPSKLSTGGAGLGFKYLVENAASVYVITEKRRRTIVACAFLLKGVRANMTEHKHLHVEIR